MSKFIDSLDDAKREKLNKFLKDLCGCATYQFSDKRWEWGIEEFAIESLGTPNPDEDESDEADDAMYETHQAIIEEFERIFELGLKAAK